MLSLVKQWFESDIETVSYEDADQDVAEWFEKRASVIDQRISKLKSESVKEQIISLGAADQEAALDGFASILQSLNEEARAEILRKINLRI
jgi:acetyl-CoA carboxylase/biotin carboxylase 1